MKTLLLSFGVLALILVSANALVSSYYTIAIYYNYMQLFTCTYVYVCHCFYYYRSPFNPLHCRNVRCAVPAADCDRGIIFTPLGQCCHIASLYILSHGTVISSSASNLTVEGKIGTHLMEGAVLFAGKDPLTAPQ